MTTRNTRRGFTLIELLVVVLIIGILAAVAVPQYQKAVIKARFAEAFVNLKTISQADKVCRLENNADVCDLENLDIDIPYDTEYFHYAASSGPANSYAEVAFIEASAFYRTEDVCLCVDSTGKFSLRQDDCGYTATTHNYSTLLGVPIDSDCTCC